jgi:hypothetical protein
MISLVAPFAPFASRNDAQYCGQFGKKGAVPEVLVWVGASLLAKAMLPSIVLPATGARRR